jgi:hypothetical protein
LVAEFKEARDWRAFAIAARSRPEEGGYFYAMYVSDLCGRGIASRSDLAGAAISTVVGKTGTVSPAMLRMIDKFRNRCASFSLDEASDMYLSTKDAAADGRDPIVNAVRGVSIALTKKDPQFVKEALRVLMSLDDPLAPYKDELLLRVMSKSTEVKTGGDLWFDGALYGIDDPDKRSTLLLAVSLAACSTSAPCELDDQMMLGCIGGQICTDSREDYLRQQYVNQGGMSQELYAQAVGLSNRISHVIASRQVEALVR